MFFIVYSNQVGNVKRSKAKIYYITKGIIDNYNVIINRENFYDQTIASDMEWYKEIIKRTTKQGEDYTAGCWLNYDYIKNNFRLIAADLSKQQDVDDEPKTIQQIEPV